MQTRRVAVQLNRSLVVLLGFVIEKTDVAYLRSFPCVVVKETFQVTCGLIQKLKLILFCREPASSRRQKISMILQFAPLIDQISAPVLGYSHGKGRLKSIPKSYWGIGKRVPQIVRKTSGKFI